MGCGEQRQDDPSEQAMNRAASLTAVLATLATACWPADGDRQATHGVTVVTTDPQTIHLPVVEGRDIRFVRLRRSQGLSQQRVTSMAQDKRGFLWFGTQFGLNRYDGYHFKIFKQLSLQNIQARSR